MAAQYSVISDPPKPFGQYMLQHQPQKFESRQGADVFGMRLTVLILKADLPVDMTNDTAVRQYTTIQVPGQVLQRWRTFTDMLAIDHPFLRQLLG